ncbi:MAG: S-layer homology domain-containing protein [Evtepia sp.]
MKFHLGFKTILAAGLVSSLLMSTVLALTPPAVPDSNAPTNGGTTQEALQPNCIYGQVTSITPSKDGSCILLKNTNDQASNQEIAMMVSDQTMIVDAVTGNAKTMKDIKQNETLYAYVGPAMTMSLPPQTHATLILCNIPADFAVPKYAQVQTVTAIDKDSIDLLMTPSVILHLNKDTQLLSYGTDKTVTLADIKAGSYLLSWYTKETRSAPGQANPTKVMLFPQAVPAPAATVTRGEFMDMLYASAKNPAVATKSPFVDADNNAVAWAFTQKIATGTAATTFNPNDTLTREQMMMFLLRYATATEKGPQGSWAVNITYEDRNDIAPWATSGAMWNQITKLIPTDANNRILPTAKVTHAEATSAIAALLAR